VVLCVDEKSQIQALDRGSPVLALMPAVPGATPTTAGTTDHESPRRPDVASDQVIAEMTPPPPRRERSRWA
jgi:hypothetical protein